jgi:predicted amidohydrolase
MAAIRLRVASVQHKDGDREANFTKIGQFVTRAATQGAELVVFPECCVCGYWFIRNLTVEQLSALAEPIPDGPSTQRLVELARRHRITIGAGWIESAAGGVFYNTYVVALPDGTLHTHRELQSFELMRWLPSRAHDNGFFLVFSNGVGVDDDEIRTGNAMILDPYGRILAETWQAADAMVMADLDATLLQTATGRRWMRARRPELYGPLTVRTGRERDTRELKFPK